MSTTELKKNATSFVTRVLTETRGQKPPQATVKAAVNRIVKSLAPAVQTKSK